MEKEVQTEAFIVYPYEHLFDNVWPFPQMPDNKQIMKVLFQIRLLHKSIKILVIILQARAKLPLFPLSITLINVVNE